MKMQKAIAIAVFVLSFIQLSTAQKIRIIYKVKSADSLYVFADKAFSDKTIQTQSDQLFSKKVLNNNITSIEDNVNRKFEKVEFRDTTYYSRVLNKGYYNLYEIELNNQPVYIIRSENDNLIIERKDSTIDGGIIRDRKYVAKLVLLCKDYPDLWKKAGNINFRKEELQDLISVLNDKHSDNSFRQKQTSRIDYLSFSIKGTGKSNVTDIIFSALMSQYFLNLSPNLSLRYGLQGNYFKQTLFIPEAFITNVDANGVETKSFYDREHYETVRVKSIEVPVFVNYEKTNSTITPYFYGGLAPLFFAGEITVTNPTKIENVKGFNFNMFAAAGIKVKLSDNLNIMSEYRFDLNKGLNLKLGVECFLELKK